MLFNSSLKPRAKADGPVFISYRQSDGRAYSDLIEAFLWAGGIACWHDVIDLPAGETDLRIREAFRDGISSAILIVTPQIAKSEFVSHIELPPLLALDKVSGNSSLKSRKQVDEAQFRLYIVNTIAAVKKGGRGVDYDAPDRLLRPDSWFTRYRYGWPVIGKPLARRQQYDLLPAKTVLELQHILRDLLRQRMAVRSNLLVDRKIDISLQTRPVPDAYTQPRNGTGSRQADLVIRLSQNTVTSIPSELGYRCLQHALPVLIDVVHNRQIKQFSFSGGAHQSVYWALGAALPETRHALGSVEVVDIRAQAASGKTPGQESAASISGESGRALWQEHPTPDQGLPGDSQTHAVKMTWDFSNFDEPPSADSAALAKQLKTAVTNWQTANSDVRPSVVVFMTGASPNTYLISELVKRLPNCMGAITLSVQPRADKARRFFPTNEGHRLAYQLSEKLRTIHRCVGTDLNVASSLPAPLMLLTARRCNTIPVMWYEPESQLDGQQQYRAVIRCVSGQRKPITHVYFSPTTITRMMNLLPEDVVLLDPHNQRINMWPAATQGAQEPESCKPIATIEVDGAEIPRQVFADTAATGEPKSKDSYGYIVSKYRAKVSGRADFFFPVGEVRDAAGRHLGYRALGSHALPFSASDSLLDLLS